MYHVSTSTRLFSTSVRAQRYGLRSIMTVVKDVSLDLKTLSKCWSLGSERRRSIIISFGEKLGCLLRYNLAVLVLPASKIDKAVHYGVALVLSLVIWWFFCAKPTKGVLYVCIFAARLQMTITVFWNTPCSLSRVRLSFFPLHLKPIDNWDFANLGPRGHKSVLYAWYCLS